MSIRTLLTKYNIRPQKKLGQCFLVDPYYITALVEATGVGPEDIVIEIGAGAGTLTVPLIARAKHVVAIEFDRTMLTVLRGEGIAEQCTLLAEDVLRTDFTHLVSAAGPGERKPIVVGNLPYAIATEVIFRLLAVRTLFTALYLTVQKEVAHRIVAQPGHKPYGVLSVLYQLAADVEALVSIPQGAFYPVPKVDSTMVGFWPVTPDARGVEDEEAFRRVVRAAFAQRRKTLLNALAARVPEQRDVIEATCRAAGIAPVRRAETLGLAEFARLTDALARADVLP